MDRQPHGYEDMAFGLLVGVAAVTGVFWAGGAASAWASGHRLPHGEPLAGLAALAHLSDPSKAWHSPVGPPEIYWACTAAALAVAGFVAFAGWRLWRFDVGANKTTSPVRAEGLALRSEVRRAAGLELWSRGPRRSDRPCNTRVLPTSGTASGRAAVSDAGHRWRTRCCCWARHGPARARAS